MRSSCGWKPGLTKTFRNKSGMLLNDTGLNLQNPSERVCRIHIPDEGCEFIQADLAGAEALDVAMRTPRGGKFRLLFEHGIKPHVFVAMNLFQEQWAKETPYDVKHLVTLDIPQLAQHPEFKALDKIIKKHYERYFIGKKTCHSFNYLKMPGTFRFDVLKESEGKVVLSLKQAEEFRSIYLGLFPEIFADWHQKVISDLKETRTIYNSLGYPHYFSGHVENDKTIREAVATGPQSTVGCVANIAACDIQDYIEVSKRRWDLLNNKHDSLLAQAPAGEEAIECAKKLVEYMGRVELCSPFGEKFFMRVEVAIGKNWDKESFNCKNCNKKKELCSCGNYEAENPEGMREVKV